MGCNCKNKSARTTKKTMEEYKKEEIQSIQNTSLPTWEEIIKVKDYLNSKNKTEEGRVYILQFNEKYFGEINNGYCDQVCLDRIRKRVESISTIKNQLGETI